MNSRLTIFFLFWSIIVFGQECDCLKNIQILQGYVEKNQASYQHQVIENNRVEAYSLFKNEINTKAKKVKNKRDCIGLISIYLSFIRDEHSFIYYDKGFDYKNNHKKIRTSKCSKNNFEGKWYYQDGSFSIKIIPYKNGYSSWAAVMQKDDLSQWKKGQVKMEFFKDKEQQLKCVYWNQNLMPKVYDVAVSDSVLQIGRYVKFYREEIKEDKSPVTQQQNGITFKELTASTNYLKIPSFHLSQTQILDSILIANKKVLNEKENLIIDIRFNGGGGFDAFKPILPYVLETNTVEQPYYGSVWVSEDNYNYYDTTKYDYAETKQDSIYELEYVNFLKTHLGKFTPIENEKDSIILEEGFPKKIGLIFNKYSASTSEGFILMAMQSKKVTTFGENTMGAVSYGDWMPFHLPELNLWVSITTKKMIFKNNEDFESIGIAPKIDLTAYKEDDWIRMVTEQLEGY